MPHTVALQTASLTQAATRPPRARLIGVSSKRASWKVACLRPRLTHCPTNAWSITAGSVPAMRASTVLAACTPSGPAAWQLIRSGRPDGAAASPAATMCGSSMPVRVSSVSSRPRASVLKPLRAAKSGTPKPAVHTVTALRSSEPSMSRTAPGATASTTAVSRTSTPSLRSHLATERRPAALNDGPSTPPQTNVTRRPCSASSEAVSMPVNPAPTTTTGASGCSSPSACCSRSACSNSAMG